eukprot:Sspe_Gene.91724::Locus_63332_Transcript_3_4_Confidence_0.333_Length_2725::g.91724::m.91724
MPASFRIGGGGPGERSETKRQFAVKEARPIPQKLADGFKSRKVKSPSRSPSKSPSKPPKLPPKPVTDVPPPGYHDPTHSSAPKQASIQWGWLQPPPRSPSPCVPLTPPSMPRTEPPSLPPSPLPPPPVATVASPQPSSALPQVQIAAARRKASLCRSEAEFYCSMLTQRLEDHLEHMSKIIVSHMQDVDSVRFNDTQGAVVASPASFAAVRAQLFEREGEVVGLQSQLHRVQTVQLAEHLELTNTVSELQQCVATLTQENQSLALSDAAHSSEITALQSHLQAQKDHLAALKAAWGEKEARLAFIADEGKREISLLREEHAAALDQLHGELESKKHEVERLRKDKKLLSDEVDKLQAHLTRQADEATQQRHLAESACEQRKQAQQEAANSRALKKVLEETQVECAACHRQLAEAKEEIVRLQESLRGAQQIAFEAAERAEVSSVTISRREAALDAHQEQLLREEERLRKDRSEMEERIEQLVVEVAQGKAQLDDSERALAAAKAAAKHLEGLHTHSQREAGELHREIGCHEQHAQSLAVRLSALEEEHSRTEERHREMVLAHSEAERVIGERTREAETYKRACEQLEGELVRKGQLADEAAQRAEQLATRLAEEGAERTALAKEVDSLRLQHQAMREELELSTRARECISASLREGEEVRIAMATEVAQLREAIERQADTIMKLEGSHASLEREYAAARGWEGAAKQLVATYEASGDTKFLTKFRAWYKEVAALPRHGTPSLHPHPFPRDPSPAPWDDPSPSFPPPYCDNEGSSYDLHTPPPPPPPPKHHTPKHPAPSFTPIAPPPSGGSRASSRTPSL